MKIKKHIQIVRSNNKRLSSMSQVSCDAILAVLSKHYVKAGVTVINTAEDLEQLTALNPDLVFLGMMFVPEDDSINARRIWLSDYLEQQDIAYTGSGRIAHQLERDKALAKQRAVSVGLKTSPFTVFYKDEPLQLSEAGINFPLFVKPNDRGGGSGIDNASVTKNVAELEAKLHSVMKKLHADALVEEYLSGREFSVAVLKSERSDDLALMPLELIAPANANGERLLSGSVKDADTETFAPVTDQKLRADIGQLAAGMFRALGARDYGRIDIRLDSAGVPHFLEANLLPSLIDGFGNFPKACLLNLNLGYEDMILHITRLGLVRMDAAPLTASMRAKRILRTAAPDLV